MLSLYNIVLLIAQQIVKFVALFSPKIALFVNGRKSVFATLKSKLSKNDKTIWFHAASLGEYEQGLPVMEAVKRKFKNHKIVLTFFSPSGFEVRKNNTVADVTVYLPLDTKGNAKMFLELVHPDMVFFIKYEFWPNYLNQIKKQNSQSKLYLISGIFRENQAFFKYYGSFYRKALKNFDYFFVQNMASQKLLRQIGFTNAEVSGDTRFDRVVAILERDNSLDFIEQFKGNSTLMVVGSSWPKDEEVLVDFINSSVNNIKFIIAPHNIKSHQIVDLQTKFNKKTILFSKKEPIKFSEAQIFIIDTIGILTKIYSYADIAYVGGGFGNPGVHNILEVATFGVPVIIGPNFSHFSEAIALEQLGGIVSITTKEEFAKEATVLINSISIRKEKGRICSDFVQNNKGATEAVLKFISQ
jgi:3-deoxy-D-manno-octulosonic-acid transferase